jgi:hypothetical protein
MGAVIKFPRGIRLRGRPAPKPDASAVVIILPVVRIERARDAPSFVKAESASKSAVKPVSKSAVKSASKSVNKKAATGPAAKPAAKSASVRKRRKRVVAALASPACGGR